ncbi:TPA: hypothetical protein L3I95_003673 [Enterobacter cloacae]|nr:hypothetical protein [Enterobacter cloacae]HED1596598.1 hypothetical protein [Enterobacter cloacae subsp. cloacae]HED2539740.1 hypothetical protein [Enterobacter cloacae subsp. cloacae]
MSTPVYVVNIRGFEGEMEAVAAFTTYNKAREYLERNGFKSWAIEELTPDEECHEETNV